MALWHRNDENLSIYTECFSQKHIANSSIAILITKVAWKCMRVIDFTLVTMTDNVERKPEPTLDFQTSDTYSTYDLM